MPSGRKAKTAESMVPLPSVDSGDATRARAQRKDKLAASRARAAAASAAVAATSAAAAGGGGSGGASPGGGGKMNVLQQMRKLRNRESAAISRGRESGRVGQLEDQVEALEAENLQLRQRVDHFESAEAGEEGSDSDGADDADGSNASDDAAAAGDVADIDDEEEKEDGDDDGGDKDDSLTSEVPGNPRLLVPLDSVAASVAAASDNSAPSTAHAAIAAPSPRSGFYSHAIPHAGAAHAACGASHGAAHSAAASFNMISRPAVFA